MEEKKEKVQRQRASDLLLWNESLDTSERAVNHRFLRTPVEENSPLRRSDPHFDRKLNGRAAKTRQSSCFFFFSSSLSHSEDATRGAKEISASCHLAGSGRGGRIPGAK